MRELTLEEMKRAIRLRFAEQRVARGGDGIERGFYMG